MNDLVRFANSVEYATGKKRGRRPVFNANQFYPYVAERRLRSAIAAEMERFIGEAYEAAVTGEVFTDTLEDLANLPEGLSENFRKEISYAAESIAQKVSSNIANFSEMSIGKPYYPPETDKGLLKNWEANFQTLCKSAESDAKKEISRIVKQAKDEGWNRRQLEKAVKTELPSKYKHRADLIARTESAKLNSEVTRATYREIGVGYYRWMASMDERVRPEHAMMHDMICSVDNPDVYYEENPDDPLHPIEMQRDDTMVHLHPGEDFNCRCTMVAWDPELDGRYEIKERPEEENQEKTEEGPQGSENDPAGRKLEHAENRLAERENELKSAKNDLKTAKEELLLEKSARKAAETAKKEAENAQKTAEKRVAEKTAENADLRAKNAKAEQRAVQAEKRAEMAEKTERQRDILQKANERHLKRTEEHKYAVKVEHAQRQNKYEICNELGIDIPKKGMTHKEADSGHVNPNYMLDRGFRSNCQSCVPVYFFRKKYGVDATAIRCPSRGRSAPSMLSYDTANAYRTVDGERRELRPLAISGSTTLEDFFTELKSLAKEEGDYALQMRWKKGGGHIINFTKGADGEIKIYDNQRTGSMSVEITLDRFSKEYFEPAIRRGWSMMRIDDLVFNKEVLKGILDPKSVKPLKKTTAK